MTKVPLILLVSALVTAASFPVVAETPGVRVEFSPAADGARECRFATDPDGSDPLWTQGSSPLGAPMPDTAVLWVDRNHLNAIANDVFISGDGMNIFVGWWLNNERVSFYRTLASETPVWFRNYQVDWEIAVGGSFDASALAANGSGAELGEWGKMSFIPNWSFSWPSGYSGASSEGADVSKDGSLVAAVAAMSGDGLLYVFEASTGDTVYTRRFNPTRGLYGVDISSDGHVVVVSTYDMIFVWEDGSSRGTLGNYGQTTARTSGDGSVVVTGDFNGYARAFRWNPAGPYYELVVNDYTGHPWVTSVAVSDDGSTFMAGTFQYSPANTGKVLMYDTNLPDPLWEYSNFGDYVGSVALTPDGSRAACGSWGQYGGTYGEVLSVFERSSSTPIFSLMDDLDEPGSIFSVAISDSGDYVAAGGKAVHAREFGNGGQVYAIVIGEPPSTNVATSSIDSPGMYLEKGNPVSPEASFANYGQANATFSAHYEVYDSLGAELYSDSQQVTDLAPGAEQQVIFGASWTPNEYGPYSVVAYAFLAGDQYPGDDTLTLEPECMHDARATRIKPPFPEVTVRMPLGPVVTVKNEGSYTDTVTTYLSIEDSLGTEVHADTQSLYPLAPDSSYSISFNEWTPQTVGQYKARAWTWVRDEYRQWNDSTAEPFQCTYEIIYDDGGAEGYYIVSGDYYDNMFAQRFTPTIDPPYYLTGARIWVNGTQQLELTVHEDSAGLPGAMLVGPDTVMAVSAPGWAAHVYPDYALEPLVDFWLEVHWMASSPLAPGIGADMASPREFRSWWFWTEPSDPGWHNWTGHDWMIRATVLPHGMGVDEEGRNSAEGRRSIFRLHQNSPNPFSQATSIRFDLGPEQLSRRPRAEIYDASGRLVLRIPIESGAKGPARYFEWDGSDEMGKKLPSGVYFLRLRAGQMLATRKMVMLK